MLKIITLVITVLSLGCGNFTPGQTVSVDQTGKPAKSTDEEQADRERERKAQERQRQAEEKLKRETDKLLAKQREQEARKKREQLERERQEREELRKQKEKEAEEERIKALEKARLEKEKKLAEAQAEAVRRALEKKKLDDAERAAKEAIQQEHLRELEKMKANKAKELAEAQEELRKFEEAEQRRNDSNRIRAEQKLEEEKQRKKYEDESERLAKEKAARAEEDRLEAKKIEDEKKRIADINLKMEEISKYAKSRSEFFIKDTYFLQLEKLSSYGQKDKNFMEPLDALTKIYYESFAKKIHRVAGLGMTEEEYLQKVLVPAKEFREGMNQLSGELGRLIKAFNKSDSMINARSIDLAKKFRKGSKDTEVNFSGKKVFFTYAGLSLFVGEDETKFTYRQLEKIDVVTFLLRNGFPKEIIEANEIYQKYKEAKEDYQKAVISIGNKLHESYVKDFKNENPHAPMEEILQIVLDKDLSDEYLNTDFAEENLDKIKNDLNDYLSTLKKYLIQNKPHEAQAKPKSPNDVD